MSLYHNFDNSQMPAGFGISLSENQGALEYFSALNPLIQEQLIDYIERAATDEEAKERVANTVAMLANHKHGITG